MRRCSTLGWALLLALSAAPLRASADEPHAAGGRINNLKVLSDKVDDVSTVECIVQSFAKPSMSDREKSEALWRAIVKYRHQAPPPNEFLAADWEAHDPVKIFNVYGYCMCCCTSALFEALSRADGREARGRILQGHSVPEVRYAEAWHMFDGSLLTYFPEPKTGAVASVDEIVSAIAAWYEANPGYKGKPQKLLELMRSEGWTGWKAKGPELLAGCPFYQLGYLPARTHGWDATMAEYGQKSGVYEYGYHVGHRALFSLRPGETLVREAGNRGLHVNADSQRDLDLLHAKAPEADLVYLNQFFPGYRGGVIANGVHRYAPALANDGLAAGAEVYENLASGGTPALHVKASGKAGVAVFAMNCPYVYLSGRVKIRASRTSGADRVSLAISTNNGRSFEPIWTADALGTSESVVELKEHVLRRYSYLLKLEIEASSPRSAGVESIEVSSDIQHAPRTLPWLGRGANTITIAAGADSALATRTVACRITPDAHFTKNESTQTMGVTFENLDVRDGSCWWKQGTGTMTVPIDVPGDLAALRLCAQVRARGDKDLIRIELSTDAGQSWRELASIAGPTPGVTRAFRFDVAAAHAHRALLRFSLSGNNTVGIMSFRVDADYLDPLAAPAHIPFHVVHRWLEDENEKEHDEPVESLPHSYIIETKADPEMVSVSYTMPSTR